MSKPTLSLCMIVKDESEMLGKCLESVKDLVDEMIVVDTGSVDNTKEIATSFGAQIYDYTWNFDFASARNFAKEKATSQWILQLDADEYVQGLTAERLTDILDNAIEYALTVQLMNYDDEQNVYTMHRYPRIYRNVPEIQYTGKIHEQVVYDGKSMDAQDADITLIHLGYTKEVIRKKNKTNRNIRILREELKQNPQSAFMNFNLGNELIKIKEYKKAVTCYQIAHRNTKDYTIRTASIMQLVKVLTRLKRYDDALNILKDAKQVYSDYTDLWYLEGEVLERVGREKEAKDAYQACMRMGESPRKYLTVNGIGTIFPVAKLVDIAIENRNFEQALGYLTEVTDKSKYSFYHVKQIIGILLRMFEKEKVIEFLHETYPSENHKDLAFKNRLAHHFRMYHEFAHLFDQTKEAFDEKEAEVLDFYLHFEDEKTKEKVLAFAKRPSMKRYAFVYYLLTKEADVKEALSAERTYQFMIDYMENKQAPKKKMNYKKGYYVEVLEELMSLSEYQLVEDLLGIAEYFDPHTLVEIGDLFLGYHQDDLAIQYYTKYLMINANDFGVYLKTSRLLFHEKLYNEALMFAEKANKLNPHHFKPIEIMLESCKELKEYELEKQLAKEFLKTHPTSDYLKEKFEG